MYWRGVLITAAGITTGTISASTVDGGSMVHRTAVGLAQAAGSAVACRVGAANMLVCLGIFILILIFREEHYALLMIGTVLLLLPQVSASIFKPD